MSPVLHETTVYSAWHKYKNAEQHWATRDRSRHHGTMRGITNVAGIAAQERAQWVFEGRRLPFCAPGRELLPEADISRRKVIKLHAERKLMARISAQRDSLADVDAQRARVEINLDEIAAFNKGQRSSGSCLGHDVTDHDTMACTCMRKK
jgi:hypothetical protein